MNIDKGSFLILVATLGGGGAAGYFASQKHVFEPPPPPPAPAPTVTVTVTVSASAPPPPPKRAPSCDDANGSPAACPPPGWPAAEGGCGALPTKRCEDFKSAMKPRVAERAVSCINALNAAQKCDPNRLNLCGHEALMSACSLEEGVDRPDAAMSAVDEACAAIDRSCGGPPMAPTTRDCEATLAGMTVSGRDHMTACMKTHCQDRGLLFCEAQTDVK